MEVRSPGWRNPLPGTAQRPSDSTLQALNPCGLITNATRAGIEDQQPETATTAHETVCIYGDDNATLQELVVTASSGLAELPVLLPNGVTQYQTFGDYPARIEHTDRACAVTIQTASGRFHTVTYTNVHPRTDTCPVARAALAAALLALMGAGR